jgi:glycosyltransferase involved in cell wall biosynthesis
VYHDSLEDLYRFRETPGTDLAFLGRISPEKRVDRAIEIAKRLGIEIKIAAKVDPVDQAYFDDIVVPLLKDPLVEYVGEISDNEKDESLGNAYALLFPIDWPGPSVLVMIEAIACGTPVIAYRLGSTPEVIEDGVTGFMVDGLEATMTAVERIPTLSRHRCRRVFEQCFTVSRTAEDYLALHQRLIDSKRTPIEAR